MADDKMKNKAENKKTEKNKATAHKPDDNNMDVKEQKANNTDGKEDVEAEENNQAVEGAEEDKVGALEEKIEQLSDKHLRLQAEFDNFKRRTLREKTELLKSAGEAVLISILPVIDDFERAIQSLKDVPEDDAGKKGTLLIYSKFREFLKQNNVKEIEALNLDFDVDYHEAITKIPVSDEKLKGKVVDVVQKGYLLNDKVIRYAKVVVGE